ncbi:hypothetical protein RM96_31920 [Cupriavidus sp. IDO]|nr:hypothetical protein RM96_31920 [Cupriavidus sp. IDO]
MDAATKMAHGDFLDFIFCCLFGCEKHKFFKLGSFLLWDTLARLRIDGMILHVRKIFIPVLPE